MAMTLLVGESSEAEFLDKVEAMLGRRLETLETLTAISLRNMGFAVCYAAHHISEYSRPSTHGDSK